MSAPTTVQWLRTAVHRIAVGSGRRATQLTAWVVRRATGTYASATRWVREASGLAMLFRLGLLVGAAAILRKMATAIGEAIYRHIEDGSRLLWIAALVWILAAYRAGADDWEPKAQPSSQPEPSTDEPEHEAGGEPAATVESAPPAPPFSDVALIAAVRDIGTPNAQLVPLADHLGTTTDAVRSAAARLDWPVKDVRQTGRSASAGLRWDEAPSPSPTEPLPGVVGAGQATDDNDDDVRAVLVRDAVNPRRTTVEWRHTG